VHSIWSIGELMQNGVMTFCGVMVDAEQLKPQAFMLIGTGRASGS